MTFDDYQKQALSTRLSTGDDFKDLMHWVLGLTGEAGEVAEKLKKIVRDKQGVIDEVSRQELLKELGDVLWYIAVFAEHLGSNIGEVAEANAAKLASRQQRDVLQGSGDNR